jgi:NAD+ synthase
MAKALNITLAQINPTVGDLPANTDKIIACWESVPAKNDLIVFPELAVCGYPPEDLVLRPDFHIHIEEQIERVLAASLKLKGAGLVGAPWFMDGYLYNAALLIENGQILEVIRKHNLPNYGVFDELRTFMWGPSPVPFKFRDVRLGVMICEDMWAPAVADFYAQHQVDLLICINASPYEEAKLGQRREKAQYAAAQCFAPLLYVNQVGGQDEVVFDGASFYMNRQGKINFIAEDFQEVIYSFTEEFEHDYAQPIKLPGDFFKPKTPGEKIAAKSNIVEFAPKTQPAGTHDPEARFITHPSVLTPQTYRALQTGLQDYVRKNGFTGVILGLSGGIDSALSAVIAADALGAANVMGVMMPSRFTSPESLADAGRLAINLGIQYESFSIEDPFQSLETLLGLHGLAHENTQSRLRGLMLMALSNTNGQLVLSTGNKSEMAVGYATLYGDMNGGFNVLKDVYKTKVYELARWRNTQGAVIPARILEKVPTAELREHQTDQDSLPPYDELDEILIYMIEHDAAPAEIIAAGYARETVMKVWGLLHRAEYKRRQSCPGVKITARAFGRDRRYPITQAFAKFIENQNIKR